MKLKLQLLEAQLETQIARALLYAGALGKWMLTSVIVGVLCGLLGTAFHLGVDYVTALRMQYRWLLYCLPLAGLGIVGLYHMFRVDAARSVLKSESFCTWTIGTAVRRR